MKINKDKKLNKFVVIVIVLVVAVAAYLAVASFFRWYPFASKDVSLTEGSKKANDVNYGSPTSDQQQAGTDAKKESEERPSSISPPVQSQDSAQLAITSKNQQNGLLEIRTTISAIDNSGKCVLTMKKTGSPTVTQEAGTQSMGSYSVCMGFDVQTGSMAKGDWTTEIKYTGIASAVTSETIGVQ